MFYLCRFYEKSEPHSIKFFFLKTLILSVLYLNLYDFKSSFKNFSFWAVYSCGEQNHGTIVKETEIFHYILFFIYLEFII